MPSHRILALAVALALSSGAADAAWTHAPSGATRNVEKGVAVWRGKTRAAVEGLAGATERAHDAATVRIVARVNCDRRRTLATHGFFAGVQRRHRSLGGFPGDVYGGY